MLRKLFSTHLVASLLVALTLFSPQVIHAQGSVQNCGYIINSSFENNFNQSSENGWVFGGKTETFPTPPPYNGFTTITPTIPGEGNFSSFAALLQPNTTIPGNSFSSHISVIYQPITVPFGVTSGSITFLLKTSSSAPSNQLDLLRVGIGNGIGAFYFGSVATYSSYSSPGYYQLVTVNLNNVYQYAGQQVILQFVAQPHSYNTTGRTTFTVDSVCANFY